MRNMLSEAEAKELKATQLLAVIAGLPVGIYVKIGMEQNGGATWLDASLWQVAPPGENGEGGWEDRHPEDRYSDRILCSVSADDFQNLVRLLHAAILNYVQMLAAMSSPR